MLPQRPRCWTPAYPVYWGRDPTVPSITSHTGTHHSPSPRDYGVIAQRPLSIRLCVCVSGLFGARITSPNSGFHTMPHAMEDRIDKGDTRFRRRAGGAENNPISKDDRKPGLHQAMLHQYRGKTRGWLEHDSPLACASGCSWYGRGVPSHLAELRGLL